MKVKRSGADEGSEHAERGADGVAGEGPGVEGDGGGVRVVDMGEGAAGDGCDVDDDAEDDCAGDEVHQVGQAAGRDECGVGGVRHRRSPGRVGEPTWWQTGSSGDRRHDGPVTAGAKPCQLGECGNRVNRGWEVGGGDRVGRCTLAGNLDSCGVSLRVPDSKFGALGVGHPHPTLSRQRRAIAFGRCPAFVCLLGALVGGWRDAALKLEGSAPLWPRGYSGQARVRRFHHHRSL